MFGGLGKGATVARADVEFHAETGQAEFDIKQFQHVVEQAMEGVSKEARAGALAHEKYLRALSKVKPDSYEARRALVQYDKELDAVRRDTERLRREQTRTSHSMRTLGGDITRAGRGTIAASGAFKGLGNALFFASGAFAGGFGLVYALRTTIQAAGRAQVANVKLAQAVRNSGVAWRENRKEILDTIEAQSKLTSFDDEELKDTLGRAVIRTGNLSDAYRLNGIAADYARQSGRSLEQAMTLVLRASLGQTASLRRLGIEAEKVTTAQDKLREAEGKHTFAQRQAAKAADARATRLKIIAELEQKVSGQAAKFAQTAEGRQARFNKVLEDTQEIIGLGLLPTVNKLLTQFSNWLDDANRTGDTQKELNRLLDEGGRAAHDFAKFLHEVKDIVTPVSNELGGMHNTVKLLIEAWAVYKLVKIATAIRGIGVAWGIVGTKATVAAAETVVAEEAIAAGAVTTAGKVGLIGRAFSLINPIAIGITAGLVANQIGDARNAASHRASMAKLKEAAKKGYITEAQIWALPAFAASDDEKRMLVKLLPAAMGPPAPEPAHPGEGRLGGPGGGKGGGGGGGDTTGGAKPRTEVDIQLDISRAEASNNEAAEIKFHRELAAYYQRRVDRLENVKHKTLLQKQAIIQLNSQIDSEQSAIEGIISGQQTAARARASAAATAAREKHDAHKKAVDTHLARLENQLLRAAETEGLKDDVAAMKKLQAAYRAAAHDAALTAKEREAYEKKRLTARAKARAARATATEKRLDLKEQRLRNAVDRAEITETLKDDKRTLKALIAFYRDEAHNQDLTEKARNEAERKRIAAQKKLKNLKDDAKKVGAQSGAEFLASLQGTLNTYGGNLFAPGELKVGGRFHDPAVTAHTIIQTSLLRDQTRILADLGQRVRTPASSQGYTNITSLFDGYATG